MQRYLLWMNKQNKSLLLPGTFFEKDIQRKLDYLNLKDLNTVYVFDHLINPIGIKVELVAGIKD